MRPRTHLTQRFARPAIAVLIALALTAPAFSAGQADTAGTASTEAPVPAGFNPTGLPLVQEKATLTVVVSPSPVQTKATADFEKVAWLEEQTNVRIDWDEVRGDDATQRVNLMFAADELPDIFLMTLNENQKLEFAGEGLLLELTELIQAYAPNIQHMFEVVPASRSGATELDGSIYAVSGVNPWPPDFWASNSTWAINNAWLENLGLSVPTTTDELFDVLRAFKTQDPNGNGQADEMPVLTLASTGLDSWLMWYLFAPFGVQFQKEGFMVRDGRVVSSYTAPEMKEALTYIHRLYREGLINRDIFTIQQNELMSQMRQTDPVIAGAMGFWSMSNVLGIPRFKDTDEFVHLEVVEGPEGKQLLPVRVDAHIRSNQAFITASAAYPALAMRWIDYLYDERVQMEIGQGPIEWIDDNTAALGDVPDGMSGAEYRNNTVSPKSVWPNMYIYDEYELVPGTIYGVTERINYTHLHEGMFGEENLPSNLSFINGEEAQELARLWVPLKEYLDRKAAEFITAGNIEEEWEEYVATADRMGLAEVIAIRQREYDRFAESLNGDTSLNY